MTTESVIPTYAEQFHSLRLVTRGTPSDCRQETSLFGQNDWNDFTNFVGV